ncbi:MAG: glycogen synthase GlgA [Clostridiaceae bacterium]|nr:glycogen synthase GlgA [Clostridiaceae bacterium]
MKKSLKILFISSEVAPYAKTGGLADVAGSLPQAISKNGHEVLVVMPGYKDIEAEMTYVTDFHVSLAGQRRTCIVKQIEGAACKTYTLNNYHYFFRDDIYCYSDDGARFAFFCKASLELLKAINFKPDIIHLNDWHAGPVALLLKERYQKEDDFYKGIKTVFTIHNIKYQGEFEKDMLNVLELPDELFTPEGVEFYGKFSFIKSGILYADKINAVSRTYAKEILTPEFGEDLEGVLKTREKDLYGIVNGISYDVFNPETDPHLYCNFNENSLSLKAENKKLLQKELGLPQRNVPLICVIHRLVEQKGLFMVCDTFRQMMMMDVQFVLLGLGDPFYENAFLKFMKEYPEQVSVRIEFNENLAHKIYAGSDFFLMPSTFEPCGLGQMISLRYGTIPVVRETGGLKDTIIDIDSDFGRGNGFSFKEITPTDFIKTIKRAVDTYRDKPGTWLELVKRGLKSDFSWNRSAKEYIALYEVALEGWT